MSGSDLFLVYLQSRLDRPLDQAPPVYLSGWQVVEALWPLHERFSGNHAQIAALSYDPAFEPEADEAIEAFVFERNGAGWENLSAQAWRVLLERQIQGIMLASVNEMEGNPVMPLPSGFPADGHTAAAMLFLLHRMRLPFPVADQSGYAVPRGGPPASLRRQ